MPSVRFTNLTDRPVNVSLKQLTALHFEVRGCFPGTRLGSKTSLG